MGPRLGRVEYPPTPGIASTGTDRFNGATLRTRGIQNICDGIMEFDAASMGPRLGRVEYGGTAENARRHDRSFNGATLRTRGIPGAETASVEYNRRRPRNPRPAEASMGPRLGRVEYLSRCIS